jgi:8-oxo-dGTP pyrophosphatase MutT (NUDIX family)
MNNKVNILCNNCGKQGHFFHNCKLPITSYGIILFKSTSEGLKYLMIRRKDSFGFIDFVRGKYSPSNIEYLQHIVDEMSIKEKERILTDSFTDLWNVMWGKIETAQGQPKNEEIILSNKFDLIKNGISINNEIITLEEIVNNSTTNWKETEWEFPKGRRNHQEKDLDCALREFEEETGICKSYISIIENIIPFEEIFIGTNHKSYKHKYFLAYLKEEYYELDLLENYQKTEVSKLEWKTIEECLESIRPYNLEKKQLITNINKVLQEYRLYL